MEGIAVENKENVYDFVARLEANLIDCTDDELSQYGPHALLEALYEYWGGLPSAILRRENDDELIMFTDDGNGEDE